MLAKTAKNRIMRMLREKAAYAMEVGRYPKPHNVQAYLNRNKSAAFKCIAYQEAIRDYSALFEAAVALEVIRRCPTAMVAT